MGKRGRKAPKDPYAGLSQEFRSAVEGSSREDIDKRLSEISLEQRRMDVAQENDLDYKQKRAAATEAGKVYSEHKKETKLKIKFAHAVLKSRGLVE